MCLYILNLASWETSSLKVFFSWLFIYVFPFVVILEYSLSWSLRFVLWESFLLFYMLVLIEKHLSKILWILESIWHDLEYWFSTYFSWDFLSKLPDKASVIPTENELSNLYFMELQSRLMWNTLKGLVPHRDIVNRW